MTPALPSFRRPPVSEVALAVQFDGPAWPAPLLGLFWEKVRDELPAIQEHPPLPPISEALESTPPAPSFQIQLIDQVAMPRYWLVSSDSRLLLQIQRDRFAHNWRKVEEGDEYPRYSELRRRFLERFKQFAATLEEVGSLAPNWCETTYVNLIGLDGDEPVPARLHEVLSLLTPPQPSEPGQIAESTSVVQRYLLQGSEDQPIGRLTVAAEPTFTGPTRKPMFSLTLTARVKATAATIPAAMDALDVGRASIVRTFADVTTEAMHERWEREC
jgi:uncharacterized protein (TIGR04255 family)